MVKKFKIENFTDNWTMKVEIDNSFTWLYGEKEYTFMDSIEQMVLFWNGGKERIRDADGDILKAFFKQLASEVYAIAANFGDFNLVDRVIDQFESREGWCRMDGTMGITIIDLDEVVIDEDEFEVEEVV